MKQLKLNEAKQKDKFCSVVFGKVKILYTFLTTNCRFLNYFVNFEKQLEQLQKNEKRQLGNKNTKSENVFNKFNSNTK